MRTPNVLALMMQSGPSASQHHSSADNTQQTASLMRQNHTAHPVVQRTDQHSTAMLSHPDVCTLSHRLLVCNCQKVLRMLAWDSQPSTVRLCTHLVAPHLVFRGALDVSMLAQGGLRRKGQEDVQQLNGSSCLSLIPAMQVPNPG